MKASARERSGALLGAARSTIQDNLKRAETAELSWPLAPEITDVVLEERLFSKRGTKPGRRCRVEPDWPALVREMKRPGVNLLILWEEYRDAHPDGYGYSTQQHAKGACTISEQSFLLRSRLHR